MSQVKNLPGSIYLNNGRYWWRVKLPNETKRKAIPLKPTGSKHATTDHAVAVKIAQNIIQQSLWDNTPRQFDGKVSGLVQAYLTHCKSHYRKSNEADNIKSGLALLVELYGNEKVEGFGPLKMKSIRDKMIKKGWARSTINKRVGMIQRCFNWAVENELVHESIASALSKVKHLQAGRSNAKESIPIKPVDIRVFNAVVDHAGPVVVDMMQVQLLTGMRSSELCTIRPVDIKTKGKIWFYTPADHKTKHLGKEKSIAIGPQAQAILKPYLKRKVKSYCFNPQEAMKQFNANKHAARKTPIHHGNAPGTNLKENPQIVAGDKYDKNTYNRAITRAIVRAQKAKAETLSKKISLDEAHQKAKDQIPHFTPHQLRHTAATVAREEFGLDHAAALLGHSNIKVTQVYAELQRSKAEEVAEKIG